MMASLARRMAPLLLIGFFVTLSSAVNVTCPSLALNETALCGNITSNVNDSTPCSSSFQQYACSNSSVLGNLSDVLLVNLSKCYTNVTLQSLDPAYMTLFFSKLDTNKIYATLSQLNSQFSSLNPEWNKFFLNGIWLRLTQSLSNSTLPTPWIPSLLQSFFPQVNASMVTCLQQQINMSCGIFQELVKNLDMAFPNMTITNRQDLYPTLRSFLTNQQNVSGSACSQNTNSSAWLTLNFGKFSKLGNFSDFTTLYSNFSALDVLSLLNMQQIADFSVNFNPGNNSAAIDNIMAAISNGSSVLDFLTLLNVAASSRNISSLQPLLAQALLNKTFEALKANISSFNSSNWTTLIQVNLTNILTEITPDQLTLISANLTCDSYQAIIKGLDMKFQQMTTAKQQSVFQTFEKPFLDKQGSNCSKNLNSSDLIYLNMRNFSQFFDFSYFQTLNANFSAMNVLPLLTIPQRVNFTLGANFTDVQAASLAGSLQNTSDVYSFLDQLNAAVSMRNISSLQPLLAQALLNKTFESLKANISSFNSSDWTKLFQGNLTNILTEITPGQLTLISANLTCDSYQAIIKGLDMKFQQMTAAKQQSVFQTFVKPFLDKQGSNCSKNLNSSDLVYQNMRNFSQFFDFSYFQTLNANFSAMNVLPLLTIPQRVNFTLGANFTDVQAASLAGSLQNTSDVYSFLDQLNAAVSMKNQSMLQPPLSQALLNRTFDVFKSNFSNFSSSDWSQLFQNKLSLVLSVITPDQLNLIPSQNLSCDSYQAMVAGLDAKFSQMNPKTQQDVFGNLIQPYMKNKGPACSNNSNSGVLLKQNFGNFSKLANFSEIVSDLGNKFNAVDVLPSLTVKQLVDFTSNTTMNAQTANSITGVIQNPTDLYGFFTGYNAALLSKNQTIDPSLSSALLAKTFQVMQSNFSTFTSSNWTDLFQDKLKNVLPNITSNQLQLLPKNLSCDSYQVILKSLDSKFSQMSTGTRKDVYNTFIKSNLITQDSSNVIFCYNQSNANSSNWFVTNMASFLSFTSEGDLIRFANYSMLQTFATDPSSVNLASSLNFSGDTATYYTSLLTSSAGFNLSSLSGPLLCFLQPSALTNLTAGNEALAFISKFNKQCSSTATGSVSANPTPQELQLATSLVSKLTNFTSATITSLGQTAVGLSPGQIGKISDADLKSSVSSLASVTGWTTGQTRSIMNKLLQSNFSITNLTSLGSLVSGLPSDKLLALDPKSVLTAVSDTQFASKLSNAPPTLQNAIVKQILAADSNTSNIVKNVPGNLVSFIPSSKLIFKPALQDVNSKSWTPNQAAMFFDDVITSTNNYDQISSSVLQGFTCNTPNKIDNNQLKTLAKVMNTQSVSLSEAQLTCLSRQVTKNGYPTDLDQYPKEVFLFLNATSYINGSISCKDYYTKVGAANVSVLQKGSNLRNKLLSQALSCLNVTGSSLTDGNIQTLGQLTCDLNSSFIESSSGSKTLLSSLSQCTSFSDAQQTSIQKVLSSTNSAFGSSSTWTTDTLNSLGGIVPYLNQTIIGSIPTTFFNPWMKTSVQSSNLSRNQLANFVKYRIATKSRRAAGCPSGMQITADNVKDDLLPLSYTTTTLDACLDNDTLTSYLYILSSKAFTNEQLQVLKNRLNVLYPGGYPDSILSNLGAISLLCTDADINKWNISVDTLGTLLAVGPPDNVSQSIIAQYVKLGNPLSGSAINAIGSSRICLLNSTLLNLISSSSLSDAQPLDVSACNQTVKDALYIKASASYQDSANTAAYYNLIKPYLGGAPLADLKALAAKSPNMDISTFVKLNPNSVVNLTVSDVKSLLGNNTVDLLTQLSSPTVSQWIQNKKQTDLDTLNLGIQGGIRDTATTIATPTTKASAASPVFLQSLSFVLTVVWVVFLF